MNNVLLFLAAALCLIPGFKAFGQEAQAPVYKDGECWLFRSVHKNYVSSVSGDSALPKNGDHKICFAQGKFFALDGAAKSTLSDANLWNTILYMKDTRQLRFPLIVGQKWGDQFQTRLRGTNRLEWRNSETRVLGFDQITTPDGPHTAFKLQRDNWCQGGLCDKWVYFFSPEAKSVVKYNYEAQKGSSATWDVDLIKFWPVQ